jgi:hypothetical protein
MKAQTRKEEGTSRVFRYGSYVIRKWDGEWEENDWMQMLLFSSHLDFWFFFKANETTGDGNC